MAATIPAEFLDLFKKPAFANLATLNPDGSPQVTPVWVDFDGTNIIVNTARGRVKDRNLQREPRVALSIPDRRRLARSRSRGRGHRRMASFGAGSHECHVW